MPRLLEHTQCACHALLFLCFLNFLSLSHCFSHRHLSYHQPQPTDYKIISEVYSKSAKEGEYEAGDDADIDGALSCAVPV